MQIEKQNIPDTFSVADYACESEMQIAWNQLPNGIVLTLADNSRIQILSRGIRNFESGPDFLNAKIMRNGKILHGDIELHQKSSDFIRHGHLDDPAYRRIVLHVVEMDDLTYGADSPLRNIPVFIMAREKFARLLANSPHGPRCRVFPFMDEDAIRSFFTDAGHARILEKTERILARMIASGTEQAFLECLFSAAGSKNNSIAFRDLAVRFMKYPKDVRSVHFRALLWGESGLLPDPSAERLPEESAAYACALWKDFWALRQCALPEIGWRRDSVRPANTPERRLAMLCSFLERFGGNPLPVFARELKASEPRAFLEKAYGFFQCSDPFWDCRFTFRSRPLKRPLAVSSTTRARTFLTDVLAPVLLAYAKLNEDDALRKRVLCFLELLPPAENNAVFRNALKTWFAGNEKEMEKLFASALLRQGCMHIYNKYCAETSSDCESCLLANS